jgi:hypothetical protein
MVSNREISRLFNLYAELLLLHEKTNAFLNYSPVLRIDSEI